jgi:zona occludens toxin (predicted ATPase)
MIELLDVSQIATLLRKTVPSIRSDVCRNPSALPPRCKLPGSRRLLWRAEDVSTWLAACVETHPNVSSPLSTISSGVNLHRFVKAVVAFNFRTHKKVALGLGNTYSLTMWEGYKQSRTSQVGSWVRKYRKEVFPLYSSFKGGAQGVMVNADKRMNIFAGKKLWGMMALLIVGGGLCFYNVLKFFKPVAVPSVAASPAKTPAVGIPSGPDASQRLTPVGSVAGRSVAFSEVWRITGVLNSNGKSWVVLVNAAGAVRVESPSVFHNEGMVRMGEVDGAKVTVWSGAPLPKVGSFLSAPNSGVR